MNLSLVFFLSSTKIMKLASQWLSVTSLHTLLAEQLYNLHSTRHDIERATIKGQKNLLHLSRLYKPIMLRMNLSVIDIIHPKSNMFLPGEKIQATSSSKLHDSPAVNKLKSTYICNSFCQQAAPSHLDIHI